MKHPNLPLPDATPRPGERAVEVIQVGYFSGFLQGDSDGEAHLDSKFFDVDLVAALDLAGVRRLRTSLKPHARPREIVLYLERFFDQIEVNQENPDIKTLLDRVRTVSERHWLIFEIALGLVGFHFYMQDVPRPPSRTEYPDPTRWVRENLGREGC